MNSPRLSFSLVLVFFFSVVSLRAEFPLGVKLTGVAPDVSAEEPLAVACGPRECLVVWEQGGAPFAMKTNLAGEPLLERAFALEIARGKKAIAVATDGTSYLVAVDTVQPGNPFGLVRIGPDGAVSAAGHGLRRAFSVRTSFTLVWSGGQYTALESTLTGIYAFAVDAGGHLLLNQTQIAKASGANLRKVTATPAGNKLAIFWIDQGQVNGHVIDARVLLDPAFQPWTNMPAPGVALSSQNQNSVDIVSTESELLLTTPTSGFPNAQFLDLTGQPLGPAFDLHGNYDFITGGGTRFVLFTFRDIRSGPITSARLSRGSTIEQMSPAVIGVAERPPAFGAHAAAGNPLGGLVVWFEAAPAGQSARQVRAELVESSSGQPRHAGGRGVRVSISYARQSDPVAVQRADGQLFAWTESSALKRILLARYDAEGRPLDPEPAVVPLAATDQRAPALATDGSSALLTYYERDPSGGLKTDILHVAYVEPGSLRLRTFIMGPVFGGTRAATVACSGRQYVVAWTSPSGHILMARFSTDGMRLDPSPLPFVSHYTDTRQHLETSPLLAWTGRDYYLVYQYEVEDPSMPSILIGFFTIARELHGVRLSEDLLATAPERLLSLPQANGTDAEFATVAAARGSVLAAWRQYLPADGYHLDWRTISAFDELGPIQSMAYAGVVAAVPLGNEWRLAGTTNVLSLSAEGLLLSEKIVDAPIAAMTATGGILTLVKTKRSDDALRLFVVPQLPFRARVVARP